MVVETINGIGYALTHTFLGFLRLNNLIGEVLTRTILTFVDQVRLLLTAVATAVVIALEDLAIFLTDLAESGTAAAESVFGFIDAILVGVVDAMTSVKSGVEAIFLTGSRTFEVIIAIVHDVTSGLGRFITLIWSSAIFIVFLIPKLITSGFESITTTSEYLFRTFLWGLDRTLFRIGSAPAESMVGFLGLILLTVSVRRLMRRTSLNIRHILGLTLSLMCLMYVYLIRALILMTRAIILSVEFTLSHLHVTRFHQAGDSEDETGNDVIIATGNDSDDGAENLRMEAKRRNYDLLVRRRNERRLRRGVRTSGNDDEDDEDVEEMLFEQVEREREDKLCVICQDKEKCMMILPCRHLCICQDCQNPLQSRNLHCPICRKKVNQIVKVYL